MGVRAQRQAWFVVSTVTQRCWTVRPTTLTTKHRPRFSALNQLRRQPSTLKCLDALSLDRIHISKPTASNFPKSRNLLPNSPFFFTLPSYTILVSLSSFCWINLDRWNKIKFFIEAPKSKKKPFEFNLRGTNEVSSTFRWRPLELIWRKSSWKTPAVNHQTSYRD